MERSRTSTRETIFMLEEHLRTQKQSLSEKLASGALGFMEFHRLSADLERAYYLDLSRAMGSAH